VDITAIMHNSVYEKAQIKPRIWVEVGQKRKGINNRCAPRPRSSEISGLQEESGKAHGGSKTGHGSLHGTSSLGG
jgi:hypothetical protein